MMTKRPSLKSLDRRPAPALASAPVVEATPSLSGESPSPAKSQPSRVGKKVVTVYLPESVWRELKVLAAKTDTTIDALMRRGLDHVFAEHKLNRGAID